MLPAVERALQGQRWSSTLHACSFAFDTPGLVDGAPVFYPRAGDFLLDAWIFPETAWDGLTPLADFGLFTTADGGPYTGFFDAIKTAGLEGSPYQDMTVVQARNGLGLMTDGGAANNDFAALSSYLLNSQFVPAFFNADDAPICICVTQDRQAGGRGDGRDARHGNALPHHRDAAVRRGEARSRDVMAHRSVRLC